MYRVTAFHGTDLCFDSFQMPEQGVWFISDQCEAEEYGTHIKRVELLIDNPLYLTHSLNACKGMRYLASKRKGHEVIILPKDTSFAEQHVYYEAHHTVYVVFNLARIQNICCIS